MEWETGDDRFEDNNILYNLTMNHKVFTASEWALNKMVRLKCGTYPSAILSLFSISRLHKVISIFILLCCVQN